IAIGRHRTAPGTALTPGLSGKIADDPLRILRQCGDATPGQMLNGIDILFFIADLRSAISLGLTC
ncbi:MAG TPA: hypothetical protein PLZ16_03070, partial [Gammaproteobacteria bacterium]|nr:hypothetical protein [Gammaproteobacteria bacterium]